VIAADILSPTQVPPFDHSAVDGYGVRSRDTALPSITLPVIGRLLAGASGAGPLGRAAVRIMTGAPVPLGCDSVVKQEHVIAARDAVTITDAVRPGANIRRRGEDVRAEDCIISCGTVLDMRHIALLAACGVAEVLVTRRLRVAIVAFGNELRAPGEPLRQGQIFDANSAMAEAFLARPFAQVIDSVRAGDDRRLATDLLRDLAHRADLIVTSGGMAAGEEDHTTTAVELAGGAWQTLPLAMRPGKPSRVGRVGEAALLGLPGNPFAALVALFVLGAPTLAALAHTKPKPAEWLPVSAAFDVDRNSGSTEFFPAKLLRNGPELAIDRLGKGGSARLKPLAEADGLGRIDAEHGSISRGDRISFLPFSELFG
jgi:molybdopterin molybdotransferase